MSSQHKEIAVENSSNEVTNMDAQPHAVAASSALVIAAREFVRAWQDGALHLGMAETAHARAICRALAAEDQQG